MTSEAVAKPPLHVDAFVSNASNTDGFLHIDAIETIASTGFLTASLIWFALALVGFLAGCKTAWTDLSDPAELTLLEEPPIVIARDGAALRIVTDSRVENRRAAIFLADTIEEICGTRPRTYAVLPGQTNTFEKGLFLGRAAADAGGREGTSSEAAFRVVAKDGCVRFLGRADYAVFDWCERYLDVRYYSAGGKCFDRRDEIVVPAVDYSDAPAYEHRLLSGSETWARFAKAGSEHRGGVQVHAPHGWYREADFAAAHPEIFETGRTPMLCYGKPATLACYEDRIEKHLAGIADAGGIVNTNRKVVTVSQWDAPVRCRCAACQALVDPAAGKSGAASPILWGHFLPRLAAWLAQRHPDYMISFLPYLNTVDPVGAETGLAALGNCEAEVCTMPGLALLKDRATRRREEGILRGWQRATGRKVLNWNYGCWPLDFTSAPYVFGRTIRRHCAAMTETVAGTFICGGEGDPRIALSLYVWMKCLWNPALDVEAVYDEFARRMFGPAARPMRELIALQERCWERTWDSTDCTYHNVFEVSYPPEDVARMKALLQEARSLVKGEAAQEQNETWVKRVAWYASGLSGFFAEEEAAMRKRREPAPVVRVGEVREMVLARAAAARPWAKTTVEMKASRREGVVEFVVRCEDPAAARMKFDSIDGDFVWGDDCVSLIFEGLGKAKVFKDGSRTGEFLVDSSVAHDSAGWTVTAAIRLPKHEVHSIRGNVCRWRVGDRREPEDVRVPGSCYEHSRLNTLYTYPDHDPSAFVTFALDPRP